MGDPIALHDRHCPARETGSNHPSGTCALSRVDESRSDQRVDRPLGVMHRGARGRRACVPTRFGGKARRASRSEVQLRRPGWAQPFQASVEDSSELLEEGSLRGTTESPWRRARGRRAGRAAPRWARQGGNPHPAGALNSVRTNEEHSEESAGLDLMCWVLCHFRHPPAHAAPHVDISPRWTCSACSAPSRSSIDGSITLCSSLAHPEAYFSTLRGLTIIWSADLSGTFVA